MMSGPSPSEPPEDFARYRTGHPYSCAPRTSSEPLTTRAARKLAGAGEASEKFAAARAQVKCVAGAVEGLRER